MKIIYNIYRKVIFDYTNISFKIIVPSYVSAGMYPYIR